MANQHTFDRTTLQAVGGPADGDYYGMHPLAQLGKSRNEASWNTQPLKTYEQTCI